MYTCQNCNTEFIGQDLHYCPHCGKSLKGNGKFLYAKTLDEYLKNGWHPILFRAWGAIHIALPISVPKQNIPESAIP